MSLKSRLDEVLGSAGWLTLTDGSAPTLESLADRPVVVTRYAGFIIDGPRKRHAVQVALIIGVAETTRLSDGDGFEEYVDRLVDLIYTADDAYPERLSATVDYRSKAFHTKREYVSIMLTVLEE